MLISLMGNAIGLTPPAALSTTAHVFIVGIPGLSWRGDVFRGREPAAPPVASAGVERTSFWICSAPQGTSDAHADVEMGGFRVAAMVHYMTDPSFG